MQGTVIIKMFILHIIAPKQIVFGFKNEKDNREYFLSVVLPLNAIREKHIN